MNQPLTAGNPRVKDARRLSRRSERSERRLFLAEGSNALTSALARPGCVVEVFATAEAALRYAGLLAGAPEVTLVDDRAMAALSEAVTPPGLLAVCRFLDVALDDVLATSPRLLAVCADVRDPGNAGTVVRTADAAGADAVVLAGDAVDLHNPKTIRASAGSAFTLPVAVERDPAVVVRRLRAAGLAVLATTGGGDLDLFEADDVLAGPVAWLLGNEAAGLPDDLLALADHRVSIPIRGGAESLNLATAAAVCLYASARVASPRPH
ncbi:RNA methyltransferase [uncultured Nocardioides sp.]|uniref:TrmH family RNA methyltransferase n=1 Tax=uncultured Nocardioides sp. TaxID=198441 RepID=UPI00262CA721|nr:RNA methyltransferase [uncultured Nocardioides sp.]